MRDMNRRLTNLEKKLNLLNPQEPLVIVVYTERHKEAEQALPKDVEEWLTCQEQLEQCHAGIILLFALDEVRARKGLPPIMRPNVDYAEKK